MSRESVRGASLKQKQQEKDVKIQEQLVKQDPSLASGLQWAYQAQTAQTAVLNNQQPKLVNNQTQGPKIVTPGVEDVAVITTAVALNEETAEAPGAQKSFFSRAAAFAGILCADEIKKRFRDAYLKSKSHNLLLERFMSGVKLSSLNMMLTLAGVSPGEIETIRSECRDAALKEIDTKISQDWANAKAMLEVFG
ncbi:MAG: hypothetical protein PHH14_05405 [Candidatus Margulisbacteria bacterium]|nr:hypothetical protein [Candidatus Margulisiibacteriota bacterium]